MQSISLEGATSEQILLMGDALAQAGFADVAKTLYTFALDREPRMLMRYQLRMRLGMVSAGYKEPDEMRLLKELEQKHHWGFVSSGLAVWFKTIPFMDDERFLELEQKHAHLLAIPNWHWNLHTVLWAVQQTADVEGDHLELGVFRGHTTMFLADYVEFQDWTKRWVLIDTFDGVPEDQLDAGWQDANRTMYKGTFSYEEVVQRFAAFPNIEVVRGRVPEILPERCPERISFMHLDLNNSTAELAALEFVIDRLSPGAVVVLDDYGWANSRVQFAAERKWFNDRGLHILSVPTGQGVFIKK